MTSNNIQIITLLALAVIGRIVLKFFPLPSVEPIIPLAVLAGLLYGMEAGLTVGALGFFISNFFVPGGQGFWTVWQAVGAGLAGAIAGTSGTQTMEELSAEKYIGYAVIGTLIFEVLVNLTDGELFVMPFTLIHIISSIVLGYLIYLAYKG